MASLRLELPPNEMERLRERAKQLGYDSPDAYLQAVVEEILATDEESVDVIEAIREGLADIRAGRTYPASELRQLLESDDTLDE